MIDEAYELPFVPKGAWLEERYVRCGRDCRCTAGQLHGTYWRLCWRERRRKRQRYVPREYVHLYQRAIELRKGARRSRHRGLSEARTAIRDATELLRA